MTEGATIMPGFIMASAHKILDFSQDRTRILKVISTGYQPRTMTLKTGLPGLCQRVSDNGRVSDEKWRVSE